MFVIQKHAARRLHYDFRLEMDGVLKSWAVPKGLPTRKGDRRLAIHVEDHPLDYGGFEGTIPAGNYGAGTVMLWDKGSYSADNPRASLTGGKIRVKLNGKKLHGEWTLVRMKKREDERQEPWLILKSGEDQKAISKKRDDESVLSDRSMTEITNGKRVRKSSKLARAPSDDDSDKKLPGLPKQAPRFVEPMKALLVKTLPKGDRWVYEIKFDGVRVIAIKRGRTVHLISRLNHSLTTSFSEIAKGLRQFPAKVAVIDGEIVALDDQGRSSFQLIQPFIHGSHPARDRPPLLFYVFDLLNLEGRDVKALPLEHRRKLLAPLLQGLPSVVKLSAGFRRSPRRLLKEVQRHGLEGLIGKRLDSTYEPGRRSGSWIKLKIVNEQEFVIGGYTPPKRSREYFGALVIGYYKGKALHFASKVGTGFDGSLLRSLFAKFQNIKTDQCPFTDLPSKKSDPQGLSTSDMKQCTWLKPEFVCQVRFAEWTHGGHLRQPVFLGLREDKKPDEVVREKMSQQKS